MGKKKSYHQMKKKPQPIRMHDTMKSVLRRKFIVTSVYIRQTRKISNLKALLKQSKLSFYANTNFKDLHISPETEIA